MVAGARCGLTGVGMPMTVASVNVGNLPIARICGTDVVDELLDGLLPPQPYSLLKGMQLSLAVLAGYRACSWRRGRGEQPCTR